LKDYGLRRKEVFYLVQFLLNFLLLDFHFLVTTTGLPMEAASARERIRYANFCKQAPIPALTGGAGLGMQRHPGDWEGSFADFYKNGGSRLAAAGVKIATPRPSAVHEGLDVVFRRILL
jgi:hypothetical protein